MAIAILSFNFCTIIYAIMYITYTLSPNFEDKMNKDIKYRYEKAIQNREQIDTMTFLSIYTELEKLLRKYSEDNNIKPFNIKNILYQLKSNNTISDEELTSLLNLTTTRNMVVHGKINHVSRNTFETLQSILKHIADQLN